MVRYLRLLAGEDLLPLPVTLRKPPKGQDPPDFVLEWPDGRRETFELTDGSTQEYQRRLAAASRPRTRTPWSCPSTSTRQRRKQLSYGRRSSSRLSSRKLRAQARPLRSGPHSHLRLDGDRPVAPLAAGSTDPEAEGPGVVCQGGAGESIQTHLDPARPSSPP